jgi:hypothetical protein
MGRLMRLPFPAPPLMAAAIVPFLFDRGSSVAEWKIYGGNIPSTLAGEYSFSISLSLALLFFGVLWRGLETGRWRGTATVLLALSILCHAIPAFFAVVGGVLIVLLRFDWRRVLYAAPILVLGCLLTAFWSVPSTSCSATRGGCSCSPWSGWSCRPRSGCARGSSSACSVRRSRSASGST